MPRKKLLDTAILEAALEGLELQRQRLEAQIAQVRRLMTPRGGPAAAPAPKGKRTISAAGRQRIAEAQRQRWAAIKQAKTAPAPKKRRLSAEGRKNIIEATKRRWAEFRAKKAAQQAKAAAKKA
jgi:hypothetical protein